MAAQPKQTVAYSWKLLWFEHMVLCGRIDFQTKDQTRKTKCFSFHPKELDRVTMIQMVPEVL